MENTEPQPQPEPQLVEISIVQRHSYVKQRETLGNSDAYVPYTQEREIEELEESIRILKSSDL